jgi:VWFA-related protein
MRTRLSTILFAGVFSAALLAQQASTPPPASTQQPTFRAGANYVRVDMYATADGRPVEDIRADEIELREDGVVQSIEAFEHVIVRAAGPQETRIEPNTVAESRQMATDARARVFVIFLDTYHTQLENTPRLRLPLTRLLDRMLGADDLVALMTPEMAASDITFARKTTIISNIMQEEWWGRRGRINDRDPKEEVYEACYGPASSSGRPGSGGAVVTEMMARRREKLTLDALEDLVTHLRGVREERKAVITVTEGWRLYTENRALAEADGGQPRPLVPRIGGRGIGDRGGDTGDRGRVQSATGVDLTECDADKMALALVNHQRRLRDIEDDANRANVSFYPVGAQGLAPFDAPIGPDKPPPLTVDSANLRARQDSLREIAENTDGLAVVNTNDIEGGLRRIVADLTSYYLLGYYSTNTKLDGRFRNIAVRVKRPSVQVRARRGYRGLTADELLSSTPAGGRGSATGSSAPVAVAVNPRALFRIRTSGWTTDNGGEPTAAAWIVGELDYATRKELAWSAGAKADVVVVAASGAEVTSTTVDMASTEGSFAVRVPSDGRIAPGEYAIRVRVRPNGDPALPVTDTARLIIPDKPSVLGEPVLWRRGPSTGPRFAMTADPRFQRSERVRFEMATTMAGAATARMLDRNGNPMQVPVQVTERPDTSGSFRWIVADATLAPLAPGDYGVEVTLGSAKQTGTFKLVP